MRVLILGCGGFIGSHLVERLLKEEAFLVSGVDIRSDKIGHLIGKPGFTHVSGDVYNLPGLEDLIKSADVVISLTAICNPYFYNKIPLEVIKANYDFPAQIVEQCAKNGKWLIQFSTCEVYGKTPATLSSKLEDTPFVLNAETSPMILGSVQMQRWSYACAKQLLERLVYSYGMEKKLPFTIIRPFNFIGPRMDYIPGVDGEGVPRVIACFMEALMFNKPLKLVDKGKSMRAFTDIRDAVDAIVLMLKKPDKSQGCIFNIGNPQNEISISGLADLMINLYPGLSNSPLPGNCRSVSVSSEEFYGQGYEDSDRRIPDIGPAIALLGWTPRISLKDALKNTMTGFIDQYVSPKRI